MVFFKKNEKELEKIGKPLIASEKHFRDIFEKSAVGVSIVDLDGRWLDVNEGLCKITGYSKKELLESKFATITHPDDVKKSLEVVQGLISGKTPYCNFKKRYFHKNGNVVWVFLSITLFRDKNNKPQYFIVHTQDITELKKTEQELRDSEEKYRTIIEKGTDGILIIQDFLIKFANSRMLSMTGYTMEEIKGKSFLSFVAPDFMDLVKNNYAKRLAGGGVKQRYELEIIKKTGQKISVEIGGSLINYEDKPADMVFIIDVTERKQIEKDLENAKIAAKNVYEDLRNEKEALAKIKVKDEALLESIGEGVVAIDQDGKIMLMNHVAERLLGWSAEQVMGKSLVGVWKVLDEKENLIPEANRPIANALRRGTVTTGSSYFYIRKDGTKLPVAISITPVIVDNKIIGAIGAFRDITKEKEIEKLRMDFLSLASHQLRTPLSGTKWLIETMQRGIVGKMTQKQKEYLEQIYQVNERMIQLVSEMLSVLRLEGGAEPIKKEVVSISNLYEDISILMMVVAKSKKIILHNNLKEHKDTAIETDKEILKSILECFISNAINYSEKGQEITLDLEEKSANVVFSVRDNGIGIPKEEQKRIFERFYRASNAKALKPGGSGLGLNITKTLAEKIGAKISFKSEENKGSTFYLCIPKRSLVDAKL